MSDTFSKVEVITGVARRRRFSTDMKLAVVAETMQPGMSISYVARQHGLSPSLVFRWRRLMSEGGREAVQADDEVVPVAELRRLEERVRDLERLLGRKTLENEILKEALAAAAQPASSSFNCLARLPAAINMSASCAAVGLILTCARASRRCAPSKNGSAATSGSQTSWRARSPAAPSAPAYRAKRGFRRVGSATAAHVGAELDGFYATSCRSRSRKA